MDRTSIQVTWETHRRLVALKLYPEEPLDRVITRCLPAEEKKNV
jgi:hypothetical protein